MITQVDVRNEDQVNEWIRNTVLAFGKLDRAANIAGTVGKDVMVKGIEEINSDDWALVLGFNLTGLMHCMRAQILAMKSPGSIVNAASI